MPKSAIPPKPEGYSLLSFFRRKVWEALWGGDFPFASTNTVRAQWDGANYSFEVTGVPGGGRSGAGWPWMYDDHRELDPSLSYTAGYCAYISPENPICTVGIVDRTTGLLTLATAGIWLCLQDVSPRSGTGTYNVPQDPIPTNGGVVSGSPLKGDADAGGSYWILIKPVC